MTENPYDKDGTGGERALHEAFEAGRAAERAETARLREELEKAQCDAWNQIIRLDAELEAARAELARVTAQVATWKAAIRDWYTELGRERPGANGILVYKDRVQERLVKLSLLLPQQAESAVGVSGTFGALTTPPARAELAKVGTLNHFHRVNRERQHEAFAPPHSLMALVACVQEEAGELAGAVLGVTGEKKRKAHLTNADVLDAVADAMTYLSLVASNVGCDDLEKLLGDTFNMVSVRAGSALRTTLGQSLTTPPAPVSPCPTQSPGADVDDWKTSTDESEGT